MGSLRVFVVFLCIFQNSESFLQHPNFASMFGSDGIGGEIFKYGLKQIIGSDNLEAIKAATFKGPVKSEEDEAEEGDEAEPYLEVYDYMKAVMAERKIRVNRKLLVRLMDLPSGPSFHVHLARTSIVIETIGQINSLKQKHLDEKVFEIVKKGKTMQQIKTSLEKLYVQATSPNQPMLQEQSYQDFDESTIYVLSVLEMIRSDPDRILNVVIPMVASYNVMSKETFQVFTMALKMIPKTEYFGLIMDGLTSVTLSVASSGYGEKLVRLIPILARAENTSQVVQLIERESELKLKEAFLKLDTAETKSQLLQTTADYTTMTVKLFQNFFGDSLRLTMINTFLSAQGFPSINPRKLVGSGLKFIEKVVHTFTAWKVDFRMWERNIKSHLVEFEKEGATWDQFKKLTKPQRVEIMSRFLSNSFGEQVEMLWTSNMFVLNGTGATDCSELLLCHINSRVVEKGTELQKGVTKGLSLISAWVWGLDGNLDQSKLFEAILKGEIGSDCDKLYKKVDGLCPILPTTSTSPKTNSVDDNISATAATTTLTTTTTATSSTTTATFKDEL